MTSPLDDLERLGKRRARVNRERSAVLAELRAAMKTAQAAGFNASQIARAAGVSREAVRLALRDEPS
jgi:DNA-binding phage protein